MTPEPVLVDVNLTNVEELPCCGIKRPDHAGRIEKNCWLRKYAATGVRAKVLLRPDGRQCGYIEYLPGEYAWRAVDARGYMFVQCVWTYYKDIQHRGWAARMLEACLEEARESGMAGVAVVARKRPYLADARVFLKNGFEVVETAPPDYQLLVRKFVRSARNPSFNSGPRKLRHADGLTIFRAAQCPHGVRCAGEIAETARREYALEPKIVDLTSHRAAQHAPTPFAVFAIVFEGRLIADHPISSTQFQNIMRKELAGTKPLKKKL